MSKRIIPRAMFQPLDETTSAQLMDSGPFKELVRKETFTAIEEAFRNKKTFATLFEINTTGHYIDIPKQYWIEALEECIKYNLTDEKFEECLEIKNLIDLIKQPTKSISKKVKDAKGIHGDTASDKLNA
jgi:hypothetical protein